MAKLADNLRFLREQTGVHVHADLIVGLPGEDLDSFGRGFDRLVALGPQEIQVGILKRLRGTPIVRHDAEWGMVYSPHPPYEVLQTGHDRLRDDAADAPFRALLGPDRQQRQLRRDDAADLAGGRRRSSVSWPSRDWLFAQVGRNHAIALNRTGGTAVRAPDDRGRNRPREAATPLWRDYRQGGQRDGPDFLRAFVPEAELRGAARPSPGRSSPRVNRGTSTAQERPRRYKGR